METSILWVVQVAGKCLTWAVLRWVLKNRGEFYCTVGCRSIYMYFMSWLRWLPCTDGYFYSYYHAKLWSHSPQLWPTYATNPPQKVDCSSISRKIRILDCQQGITDTAWVWNFYRTSRSVLSSRIISILSYTFLVFYRWRFCDAPTIFSDDCTQLN